MNEFNGITEKRTIKDSKVNLHFFLFKLIFVRSIKKIKTHYIMQKYTKLRPAIENPTVTHLA